MKNFIKNNWFKLCIILILLPVSFSITYYITIYAPQRDENINKVILELSKNNNKADNSEEDDFICPEDFKYQADYIDSLARSMSEFQKNNPDKPLTDYLDKRYDDLISHGCIQTMSTINRISTFDTIIEFNDKEYGPYVTNFDKYTKVANVYYPVKQNASSFKEEIYFNFYFKDVYSDNYFTAETVANYIDENADFIVDYKFQAPDPITKDPAFFLAGYLLDEENNSAEVHIMKVANIGEHVYSVGYSIKIGVQNKNDIDKWFIENIDDLDVGYFGVDESWIDLFNNEVNYTKKTSLN